MTCKHIHAKCKLKLIKRYMRLSLKPSIQV